MVHTNFHREPEPPRRVKLAVAPLTGDETPELSPSEPLQNKKVKKTRNKYKPLESGTTTKSSLATSPEDLLATYTSRGYLLCKPGGKWMDQEVCYFTGAIIEKIIMSNAL